MFENYNTAIWPAQLFAYALGIAAVIIALRDTVIRSRVVSAILAVLWIWMGVFYHIIHFSTINEAARVFGALFILEGLLVILAGCFLSKLRFRFTKGTIPVIGAIFILYAMVLYPIIGMLSGHAYPRCPMYGVAPCPATIFTFGILLWATRPLPFYVVIIPFLWSLVGVSAAINLQVPQDYGLGLAGVLGLILVLIKNRRMKQSSTTT